MLFGLGALCTVLLGVLVYVFIMTIQSIKKFKLSQERMDHFSRVVDEFSSNAWRHREDMERVFNDRMNRMEMNAYEHMGGIESRLKKLEEKMIPNDAKKDILKG